MTGIDYFGPAPPKHGQPVELYPGIFWVRIQLPFKPGSVNVWLLRDPDGWTIVDAGFDWEAARADWRVILDDLEIPTVTRLLMTHAHFDHVGLSGWLCDRTGAEFRLAKSEFDYVTFLRSDWDLEAFRQYFRTAGCTTGMVEEFGAWKGWAQQALERVPGTSRTVAEGDAVHMGERDWRVLSSGGHSRGQLAFWCECEGILIGGDIVLPRIHAAIGVNPDDLLANPIDDALAGWENLKNLPRDTAVLPSHGLPFTGLQIRLEQLAAHCHQRTDLLVCACSASAISTCEAMATVYQHDPPSSPRIAILEMQAHLNFLMAKGAVVSRTSPDGVRRYSSVR